MHFPLRGRGRYFAAHSRRAELLYLKGMVDNGGSRIVSVDVIRRIVELDHYPK
jgi:hypothetical protein